MNQYYTNDTEAIIYQECIILQLEHRNQIVSKYKYYKIIKIQVQDSKEMTHKDQILPRNIIRIIGSKNGNAISVNYIWEDFTKLSNILITTTKILETYIAQHMKRYTKVPPA